MLLLKNIQIESNFSQMFSSPTSEPQQCSLQCLHHSLCCSPSSGRKPENHIWEHFDLLLQYSRFSLFWFDVIVYHNSLKKLSYEKFRFNFHIHI